MYSTSVGVLYGYAKHARAKATKDLSDELLDSLPSLPSVLFWPAKATEPLLETSIASRFAIWRSHGFQEIQELANHRWQQEIQPKCRKKSTKDHAWISPELADKLIGACTDDTFFGDHALLYATFSDLGRPEPIPIWIKPKPIQWEQVPQEAIDACEVNADTMTYQQVFSAVEDAAHHALCSAGEHSPIPLQRGRGSVVLPTLARAPITPLHQSRSHDFQIDYQGENYRHTKWCRHVSQIFERWFLAAMIFLPTEATSRNCGMLFVRHLVFLRVSLHPGRLESRGFLVSPQHCLVLLRMQ